MRTNEAAAAVREALATAGRGLVDREVLIELIALSAVAREHLLIVGPPGTAKSEAVRRVATAFGGAYFEYLLGRFTEPSELFGPVDLRKLKDGLVETETTGMLPEAEIAFLDEVFRGSTAILNTLLGILNERTFRRGHTRMQCPLRVCVGATNDLPDDDTLAAFADRFLLRLFVEPVADPQLEDLLLGGWSLEQLKPDAIELANLDHLAEAARGANLAAIRGPLAHAIRVLRHHGITLTDRRAVKTQKLAAAAALLAGRDDPTEADLWPIVYAVPTASEQRIARDALRDLLDKSENPTLPAATEDASMGPLARATRICDGAREALGARPADDAEVEDWKLKLEGFAREIDAGFSPEQLPADLKAVRDEIIGHIE